MIKLQFSAQDDAAARAIAFYERGWCSHVDSVLPEGDPDAGKLLGARLDGGVAIRPPTYARFRLVLEVELPCEEALAASYYAALRAELGKPYDDKAILGFIVGRDWRNPSAWFCSELCAAKLESAGYFTGRLATPTNKITPADLLLLCSSRVAVGDPRAPE